MEVQKHKEQVVERDGGVDQEEGEVTSLLHLRRISRKCRKMERRCRAPEQQDVQEGKEVQGEVLIISCNSEGGGAVVGSAEGGAAKGGGAHLFLNLMGRWSRRN